MGVMCEVCRTVYLVATWRGVVPSDRDREIFRLVCNPPCPEVKEFRPDSLRPYRISEDAFSKGYAREGEYEAVSAKLSLRDKPPQRR